MQRNDITPEIFEKLSELERREHFRMMNHPSFLGWPHPIQEAMKRFPPFYLYKMRSTEQIVVITQYHEKKDDTEFPVMFTCAVHPEFNEQASSNMRDMSGRIIEIQKEIFGVPEVDLERIMLRSIAQQLKLKERAKSMGNVIPMAKRQTALRKSKQIRMNKNIEKFKHEKRKEIATSFPMPTKINFPDDKPPA